jgi:hypothetical protein
MNKQTWQYIAIGVILIAVIAPMLGYNFLGSLTQSPSTPSGPAPTTGPTAPPSIVTMSAKAQWGIRDALTYTAASSSATAYVGILKAQNGVFDPINGVSEETEFDAAPDTSAVTYSSGDELLIAVSSDLDPTGGNETYPRWFYIENLYDGAPILALPLRNPISAISGSPGAYTVTGSMCENTGQKAVWLGGTTNYWDFGYFETYGRVAKQNLIVQITNKGVVGCTFNDGATWEDTDAEINANFTMTSDQEDLYFELIGEAANVAFGLPTLAVTAGGEIKQYNAVLVFTTDALALDVGPLLDDGWKQISKPDLTADLGFYYAIDPVRDGCVPGNGEIINLKVPITISDSGLTASTEYEYEGWVLDWQNLAYVASGVTTTSLPGNNGFISDPGCDAIVNPLALTVSSGSAATMQLLGHFTTNA